MKKNSLNCNDAELWHIAMRPVVVNIFYIVNIYLAILFCYPVDFDRFNRIESLYKKYKWNKQTNKLYFVNTIVNVLQTIVFPPAPDIQNKTFKFIWEFLLMRLLCPYEKYTIKHTHTQANMYTL